VRPKHVLIELKSECVALTDKRTNIQYDIQTWAHRVKREVSVTLLISRHDTPELSTVERFVNSR
jgi:hypothetical protein